MSWDRKKDWGLVDIKDGKAKVQLYSLYDIQEYYMAIEEGKEYDDLLIHYTSGEMDEQVAAELVVTLNAYKQEIINDYKPRTTRTSNDGKMSFSAKNEINGVEMNWDFLNEIMDGYDNKTDIEGDELFGFENKHGVE